MNPYPLSELDNRIAETTLTLRIAMINLKILA